MEKRPCIKIFATQRIDKKCDVFNCDFVIPVRCGAIFDATESLLQGDDEGDNISSLRESFCELTTQYWAYKNVDADYYGFCHYRRYFSFSEKSFPSDAWRSVIDSYIDAKAEKKYEINCDAIAAAVADCDIILPNEIELSEVGIKSVRDQYASSPFLNPEDFELLLEIIKERSPEIYPTALKVAAGNKMTLCNMTVMKKSIFIPYSAWLFDILFEFRRRRGEENLSEEAKRTPGHLGERLLYIYCMYLKEKKNARIKHLQTVVFKSPECYELIKPRFSDEKTARIVLSTSLYYAPFCAATVRSIIDSSQDGHFYDVVILHTELPQKTQKLFLKMISERCNFSIRFLNVSRRFSGFNLPVREHFSRETYFRLAIGELLSDYEKVLYLDSDLIVERDAFELYSLDIKGHALMGAVDACLAGINNGFDKEKPKYYEKRAFIKRKNLLKMINAGVLLMNLEFIREKYSAEKLLEYASESAFELCDQDALNSLFQDDILLLDSAWNASDYDEGTLPAWCVKFAPKKIFDEYKRAAESPFILHFSSTVKPWNEPGCKNADKFWESLRKTPFYEFLLHRRITENASYFASHAASAVGAPKKRKEGLIRRLFDKLFPRGTERRERIKRLFFRIRGVPYSGPYYPIK